MHRQTDTQAHSVITTGGKVLDGIVVDRSGTCCSEPVSDLFWLPRFPYQVGRGSPLTPIVYSNNLRYSGVVGRYPCGISVETANVTSR